MSQKQPEPVTYKWQRATSAHRPRKKSSSWVPYYQLYREIAAGYDYFYAAKTRAGAKSDKSRVA